MNTQRFLVSMLLIRIDMLNFPLGRSVLSWLCAVGVALSIAYRVSGSKIVHGGLLLPLSLQQLVQPVHLFMNIRLLPLFYSHEMLHLLNLLILPHLQLPGIPLVHPLQVLAMALLH